MSLSDVPPVPSRPRRGGRVALVVGVLLMVLLYPLLLLALGVPVSMLVTVVTALVLLAFEAARQAIALAAGRTESSSTTSVPPTQDTQAGEH